MPTFKITGPDGTVYRVNGPEGATEQEALAQVQKQVAAKQQTQQPEAAVQAPVSPSPQQSRTSQALGFYQGIMKPFDNAALALETAAKNLGVPVEALARAFGAPTAGEAEQSHKDVVAKQEAAGVTPGGVGKFAGEVVGTLPALAVSTNPIAAGAMSSALLTDKRDVGGVLTDAATGAVAGKVGDLALKGAGRVIAPKLDAATKALLGEGVEMTPGQIMGGVTKRVEDAATSIPIVGDMVKSAQRRSLESFNRAAINRTLKPLGQSLPDSVPLGNDAVAYAGQKLDDAYSALLPNLTVTRDGQFIFDMNKLKSLSQNLPTESAKQVAGTIDSIVNAFSSGAGKMSGEAMKALDSELGRITRAMRGSAVGSERLVGDALKEAQGILRDVVVRSNPAKAAQLKAIDRGYANLLRIENAASKAKDGVFTPGQLQTATRVMDSSLRKRQSARGTALMQDLAKSARDKLPSSVPDSGTAGRIMTGVGIGALGTGVASGDIPVDPRVAALGGAAAALYTKRGQNALQFLLTRRPQGAEQVADYLTKLAAPAAITGSALTTGN